MARPKKLPVPEKQPNGYWYVIGTGVEESLRTDDEPEAMRRYAIWLPKYLKMEAAPEAAAPADANDDDVAPRTVHWCLDFYGENQAPLTMNKRNILRNLQAWRDFFPKTFMVKSLNDPTFNRWMELRRNSTRKVKRLVRVNGRKVRGEDGKWLKKEITIPAGVGGKGVSEVTMHTQMTILNTALNYAVLQNRMLPTDIPNFKMPSNVSPKKPFITEEQALVLLHQFKTHALPGPGRKGCLPGLYIIGVLMFGTGSRVGAASELEWDRVDWDNLTMDFNVPGRRITKKERIPDAPIQDWMLPVLRQAYEERFRGGNDGRYVCVKLQHWGASFASHAVRAGFVKPNSQSPTHPHGKNSISCHTMRHSIISMGLQNGATMWEVGQNVRCSAATMEKIYGKTTKESKARVARKMLDQKTMRGLTIGLVQDEKTPAEGPN